MKGLRELARADCPRRSQRSGCSNWSVPVEDGQFAAFRVGLGTASYGLSPTVCANSTCSSSVNPMACDSAERSNHARSTVAKPAEAQYR